MLIERDDMSRDCERRRIVATVGNRRTRMLNCSDAIFLT